MIPDLEYVQEEDMVTHIAAPPRWNVALPMGGGEGGGSQEFLKSGPTLAFFVLIKGHTTIFFPFFLGGGRDGGQLHRETCEVNSVRGKQESFQRKLFETKIISVVS